MGKNVLNGSAVVFLAGQKYYTEVPGAIKPLHSPNILTIQTILSNRGDLGRENVGMYYSY